MKLTVPQRRALIHLSTRREVCLANMEDQANVTRATLDSLCKLGLIDFGGGEYVSVAATIEHFKNTQAFGLFASITDAGRKALAVPSTHLGAPPPVLDGDTVNRLPWEK